MKGARDMVRTRQGISIDDKIEKAQAGVVRAKSKYDAAVAELKQLMDKKAAIQKDVLMNAIDGSDKTYDEILVFLNGDASHD
jgi:hypothetical protein